MSESAYYPAGAYRDPNAPYNEARIPERSFDITCSQTLSKSVTVTTDKYCPEHDEEDGRTYANTEDTDWERVFADNSCYTPLQLIQLLGEVLTKDLEHGIVFKSPKFTEHLINECNDWIEDECEYIED